MEAKNKNNTITLILSQDEALVLLEWVTKINEKEELSLFEDQLSEERILFDLEASLEKIISETFEGSYLEILSKARQKLRDIEYP